MATGLFCGRVYEGVRVPPRPLPPPVRYEYRTWLTVRYLSPWYEYSYYSLVLGCWSSQAAACTYAHSRIIPAHASSRLARITETFFVCSSARESGGSSAREMSRSVNSVRTAHGQCRTDHSVKFPTVVM